MTQTIAPVQAYQVDLIGKRVIILDTRIRNYRKQFKKSEVCFGENLILNTHGLILFTVI